MTTLRLLTLLLAVCAGSPAWAEPLFRVESGRIFLPPLPDSQVTARDPGPPGQNCISVWASLSLDGKPLAADDQISIRRGDICPFASEIYPGRQLIVEGLDARKRRLFVTFADDPRWFIHESVGPGGDLKLEGMGRRNDSPIPLKFRVPVTDRLTRLRVWEIDEETKAHRLGEIAWLVPDEAP